MTAIPRRPSATGVRYQGDDYQMLLTWRYAVDLLHPERGITKLEMEADGAGNVDDLVIHYASNQPIYHQIKFVTDQRAPMTYEWFTAVDEGASSILQKFWRSFETLTKDGQRPHMVLHTNRVADNALGASIDGQRSTLMPRIAEDGARSTKGKVRAAWSTHLNITEQRLQEMLEHLELRTGRGSLQELHEHCSPLMEVVGIAGDKDAVNAGMGAMRTLVREGHRELDAPRLRGVIEASVFSRIEPRARLEVQQIDHTASAETATASVDWVEMFEGDDARTRRQLVDPEGWNTVLLPDLRRAAREVTDSGIKQVALGGAMRLSAGMLAGIELAAVKGFTVAINQGEAEWSSAGERTPVELQLEEHELGQGDQVAIAVAVSADLRDDVLAYARGSNLPVGKLLVMIPPDGIGREAIRGPEHARGMADAILDTARAHGSGASTMHMFAAMPLGLALLVGHIWNRVPTTQLYEDLNRPGSYAPTFTLQG